MPDLSGLIDNRLAEFNPTIFKVYGMKPSAPCRIVEMTAEVLGLEYVSKVNQLNID